MEKELLTEIIERLYQMTKAGSITWVRNKNTRTHYNYSAYSDDTLTKFNLEISLDDEQKLNSHNLWWIFIYNSNLIDGSIGVYSGKIPTVNDIVQEIYQQYIVPSLKPIGQHQELALNNILNSLDKEGVRDNRIQKILKDTNT